MEIYLIRHTSVDVPQGICYGQADVPLAGSFAGEWAVLENKIPEDLDVVYSSPLGRCAALAKLIRADCLGYDSRLLELHFGDWEMKAWDDIEPGKLKHWMENYLCVRTPQGESYADLFNRTKLFVDELLASKYTKAAVVAHAGALRTIISYIVDVPLESSFNFYMECGKISLVTIDGAIKRIKYLNL